MTSGLSIICFGGEDWWYHHPHSKNHLMRRFAHAENVWDKSDANTMDHRTDPALIRRLHERTIELPIWFSIPAASCSTE